MGTFIRQKMALKGVIRTAVAVKPIRIEKLAFVCVREWYITVHCR